VVEAVTTATGYRLLGVRAMLFALIGLGSCLPVFQAITGEISGTA